MSPDTRDTRQGDDAVAQSRDRHFDRDAQRLHAEALGALSPQTLSRLRSARHSASSSAPSRHGLGWILAAGSAAVLALAMSLHLQRAPVDAPAPPLASTAPAEGPDADIGDDYRSLVAGLDENPDLYLWVAANDDALPTSLER